jgi:hypothetical protein
VKTEPKKLVYIVTCSFGMDGLMNNDLRCSDLCTIGKPELALCKGGLQIQLNQVITGLVEELSRTQEEVSFGNNASQEKTRQDKTRQNKTRQGTTRQDMTRHDKTIQGKTRQQDKTRQHNTKYSTRQDKTA